MSRRAFFGLVFGLYGVLAAGVLAACGQPAGGQSSGRGRAAAAGSDAVIRLQIEGMT